MKRTVAFLIFDQFQLLDAAGPIAAFEMPMRGMTPTPYTIKVLSRDGGAVVSSSTAAMYSEPMGAARAIDTLIVAGGDGTREAARCGETLAFIRKQAKRVRRICSVCSGAYILAAAGLLDGRRATTHWSRSNDFARRFPRVRLQPDKIFTQDGHIWTSAGITAGIDMALALIGDDLGEPVSKRAAQQLVVYHRRSGGQSQFSALLELEKAQGRLTPLLAWIREHIGESLTVDRLARQACMSERHFARTFIAEIGITPAKAVERIRLETAREQVEFGTDSLDKIAARFGFGDTERMRKAFLRIFGQPPQSLRRSARSTQLREDY
jgi:transcriptional regulator GlxA family with amidase domain